MTAYSAAYSTAYGADVLDPTGLSRVELEPLLAAAVEEGRDAEADAIRAELAGRTWQNVNPYA